MKKQIKYFWLFAMLLFVVNSYSQQQNTFLSNHFNSINTKVWNEYGSNTHTSFQPIIQSQIRPSEQLNWLSDSEKESYLNLINKPQSKSKKFLSWLNESMFHQHFLLVDTSKFYLTADPLLNIEFGEDIEDNNKKKDRIYTNTRGLQIAGNVGQKFSFSTSLYESQAFSPNYIASFVSAYDVMPGQGRVKAFKKTGFDFAYSAAYISYSPTKNINFQIGNDKHFIGDGYRSLLLSDVSTNYPYLKTTILFAKEKLQYIKLHAELTNVERRDKGSVPEALFKRKSMSTHYINWLASKWLNIGFFESTVWQTEDNNGTKPFNFLQINPIPFVNTTITKFNQVNHSIVGGNIKFKLPFKGILYHQLIYGGSNRVGHQEGFKYFGIKNLTIQGEFNTVSPEMYVVSSNSQQNYFHYNQPLAHPYGNNFNELVGIVFYKYKRLFTQVKYNYAEFNSLFTNKNAELKILQAQIGYCINPTNGLMLLAGVTNRNEIDSNKNTKTNYFYLSLQTNLRNLYTDF